MILNLFKVLSFGLNCLPRSVVLFFGDCIGWAWYFIVPIRRSVVLSNLRLIFQDQFSENEIRRMARQNFRHYGRSVMEIIQAVTWTLEGFEEHFKTYEWHHFQQVIDQKQGHFTLNLHIGNWELLIGCATAHGWNGAVVVKEIKTQWVNDLMTWYRKHVQTDLIPETGSAKDILRALDAGRGVAFAFDQFMGPPIGLPVTFLGKPAGTVASIALFLEKKPVPVVPVWNYRDGSGRLVAVAEPPVIFDDLSADKTERLYQRTQILNNTMENIIRKHPEQWLWLHRRWKPFKGESRWSLKRACAPVLATLLALLFVAGCASTDKTTHSEKKSYTGIELPADPTIEVPTFKKQTEIDEENEVKLQQSRDMLLNPQAKEKAAPKKPKAKKRAKTPAKGEPKKLVFKAHAPDTLPWEIGEQMEIRLGWLAIPAGTATIEVRPGRIFNGRPTFQLWGNVRSNRVVDMIYSIDNTIEVFIDKEGLIPYKFLLHMDEKDQKKETRVSFDHIKGKAHYWSKRVSKKRGNQDIDRVDAFRPQAFDMWSALYYARTLEYQLGVKQTVAVYENGKNWDVEVTPVKNELVSTPVGTFQCWKLLVKVKLNNVFKPMGDIFLWLSDDSKKYIVKFEAKIKIGSLVGNLRNIREGL